MALAVARGVSGAWSSEGSWGSSKERNPALSYVPVGVRTSRLRCPGLVAAPAHFICGLPALSHFREDADRTASGRNQGKAWVVRCQVEVVQFSPPQWGLLCVPYSRVLGVAAARSTAFSFCTCFLLKPWLYPLWPRLCAAPLA